MTTKIGNLGIEALADLIRLKARLQPAITELDCQISLGHTRADSSRITCSQSRSRAIPTTLLGAPWSTEYLSARRCACRPSAGTAYGHLSIDSPSRATADDGGFSARRPLILVRRCQPSASPAHQENAESPYRTLAVLPHFAWSRFEIWHIDAAAQNCQARFSLGPHKVREN